MNPTFQKTIDRMPTILVNNAPSMIARMVASMRATIDQRGHQANASHGVLLLKVGEADLVREFCTALAQGVEVVQEKIAHQRGSPPSLSLETATDMQALETDDFQTSDAAFSRLCARAQASRVVGCDAWHKDVFLKALKQAFKASRMDAKAIAELMPFARQALNAELCRLYAKLEAVGQGPAVTPS